MRGKSKRLLKFPYQRLCSACFILLLILAGELRVNAGGAPENVFVVVNARSWASRTIANHYSELRSIPASNIFLMNWEKSNVSVSVDDFRELILKPILKEIDRRKLTAQIDYIVYSADFPYRVDFRSDLKELPENVKVSPLASRFPSGSLTGMTYLAPFVLGKYPQAYTGLNSNLYFRPLIDDKQTVPTRAMSVQYQWGKGNERVDSKGVRYIMSTMLGYTSGRGNDVQEVLQYLTESAKADGTRPSGTFYYMQNTDVRSRAREAGMPAAVKILQKLGHQAEIVSGILPKEKRDALGVMTGITNYRWENSGSHIVPGAICENFTSFGGVMHEDGGQTPLSEFLRYGATASSGTVTEPFSLQPKFPHPLLHVHYARGCSLGEAYYQAVQAPYQLLIVGDPLCQPWAEKPVFKVTGLRENQVVKGKLTITPGVEDTDDISRFDFYLDGRLISQADSEGKLDLDTNSLLQGYHTLTVVGLRNDLIETCGRVQIPFLVQNHNNPLIWETNQKGRSHWNTPLEIKVKCPGAESVALIYQSRTLGVMKTEAGILRINPVLFGDGPVRLQLLAMMGEQRTKHILSVPIMVDVTREKPMNPVERRMLPQLAEGLLLKRFDGTEEIIQHTGSDGWVHQAEITAGEDFELSGYVHVSQTGAFQFQAEFSGEMEIHVGEKQIYQGKSEALRMDYLPVSLMSGWHHVIIKGNVKQRERWRVYFGGPGCITVDGERFFHAAEHETE